MRKSGVVPPSNLEPSASYLANASSAQAPAREVAATAVLLCAMLIILKFEVLLVENNMTYFQVLVFSINWSFVSDMTLLSTGNKAEPRYAIFESNKWTRS
jgi:hypothetical protein